MQSKACTSIQQSKVRGAARKRRLRLRAAREKRVVRFVFVALALIARKRWLCSVNVSVFLQKRSLLFCAQWKFGFLQGELQLLLCTRWLESFSRIGASL